MTVLTGGRCTFQKHLSWLSSISRSTLHPRLYLLQHISTHRL